MGLGECLGELSGESFTRGYLQRLFRSQSHCFGAEQAFGQCLIEAAATGVTGSPNDLRSCVATDSYAKISVTGRQLAIGSGRLRLSRTSVV